MSPIRMFIRAAILLTVTFVLLFTVMAFAQDAAADAAPTPAAPWNAEAKILGVAGVVFGALQLAKKFMPGLSGKYAVFLNLALSLAGGAAVAQPGQLFSLPYVLNLLVTSLAASGFHGKWQAIRGT